jgi:hypothetical protein
VALWIAALCLLVFTNGKHGQPSMWHDFATHPVNSQEFIIPLVILLGVSALMVLISWRYVAMAYPSDETFYCDRSTLTISKVRWLDIHNTDWRTSSYPLDAIEEVQANLFGPALLMPASLVRQEISKHDLDLDDEGRSASWQNDFR